jgi:hypothetical protein
MAAARLAAAATGFVVFLFVGCVWRRLDQQRQRLVLLCMAAAAARTAAAAAGFGGGGY